MTKTGVVRCEPRESPGGEREAEGSARWKGMMSGGAGEKDEDGEVGEVRARVRARARVDEEEGREGEKGASDVMI